MIKTQSKLETRDAKPMREFWDIESYDNLFCVGILNDEDFLEMYYLVNNQEDANKVLSACQDSGYEFQLYNLANDASRLMWHFKRHIPSMGSDSMLAKFLNITEEEVLPKMHTYYSYNGLHYDIQMMAFFEQTVIGGRTQTTPAKLRMFSDSIIDGRAHRVPTLPYEQYGNQVDGAYLNETMIDQGRVMIGLKTLVGMLGGTIKESESNNSGHSNDIYDDILYNINDISEFRDVVYTGTKLEITETIRRELLRQYGDRLHRNNITVNSSSAKFVENIIAPDEPISDYPTCSFMYPAPHIAHEKGVEPFDILEYAKDWYMKNVYSVVAKNNPKAAQAHLAKFMTVYGLYSEFRGKNWNTSSNHYLQHGVPPLEKTYRRQLLDTYGTYLPLIDKYGNDSYTHVNFSSGGIHGAEIYYAQLAQDRKKIKELKEKYGYISLIPKKEIATKLFNLLKIQSRKPIAGHEYLNDYPQHLYHEIPALFHLTEECDEIIEPSEFTPFCYSSKDKKEKLLERYRYTSTGYSVHQDFAGYYPMLLINMGVFYDGKGKDIYREIYQHRIAIKGKLKTIPFNSPEWIATNITQEGYKLILNSASGVLDGGFDTKVRANNKAVSMRIIGQLMTWIIAQALALEGARVPSSNTDGIYVFNIDEDLNKEIVKRELESLFVEIDPEPCFLISKDTNNRAEIDVETGKVLSARGGSLTSHGGPVVDKRLTHPALVDAVLVRYLQHEDVVNKPIDKDIIAQELEEYRKTVDTMTFAKMSAWVMRPTNGSIFVDDADEVHPGTIRTWLTKSGRQLTRYATAKRKPSENYDKMTETLPDSSPVGEPETVLRLARLGVLDKFADAIKVSDYENLSGFGKPNNQRNDESVAILGKQKISNLSPTAHVYIDNSSLLKKTEEELLAIENDLDLSEYVDMIAQFAQTWRNELQPS